MLTLGLKNYFKSYRHFFVPIGALALGFVLGISIAVPWILSAIKEFINAVADLLGGISWNWDAVRDTLLDALYELDWNAPQEVIGEVFSKEYLTDLLKRCAESALGDTSAIADEVTRLSEEAIGKIGAAFAVWVLCSLLGAILGFFATKRCIRRDVARRSLWRSVCAYLLNSVINVTFLASASLLILKVERFALLALFLSVLVYGCVAFFEAYFVHGYKKVPLQEVMRVRNFFTLFLLTIIEVIIAAALFLLVLWITNLLFAAYVGFSIAVITVICISLNAEAYVKDFAATYGNADSAPAPTENAQPLPLADDRSVTEEIATTSAEAAPTENASADPTESTDSSEEKDI